MHITQVASRRTFCHGHNPLDVGSDSHCGEERCKTDIGVVIGNIESIGLRGFRWKLIGMDANTPALHDGFKAYVASEYNESAGLTRSSSMAANLDFKQTIPTLVKEFLALVPATA